MRGGLFSRIGIVGSSTSTIRGGRYFLIGRLLLIGESSFGVGVGI